MTTADRLKLVGFLLGISPVLAVASLIVFLVLARVLRIAVRRGQLGVSPLLFTARVLDVPVSFGLFPISSYIQPFPGPLDDPDEVPADAELAARLASGAVRRYTQVPAAARFLLAGSPTLLALLLALILTGPLPTLELTKRDLGHILGGVLGPFSTAHDSLEHAARLLQCGALPFARRFAPTLLASNVLITLASFVPKLVRDPLRGAKLAAFGMLVWMIIGVTWLVAIVTWIAAG